MANRRDKEESNRLSMEEAEALVRRSHEVVVGPGAGEFVSKHSFAARDLVAKVRSIDWFAQCGEPGDFDVTMPVERVKEPFRESHELDGKFVHSVQWNVLAALMEDAYMDCRHGCFFFHELLTVYQAGHLPCGWIGAWPQGLLVVY